ncbi:MAG: hypothetical protein FGF51_03800 [Candidatus Brockarchaeota archaeon]|nr:hypothetical protein [Candidatus Brockarchaeota archaeon]
MAEHNNSFLPNGSLVGTAVLENGRALPFRGDDLLEEVDGKRVMGGGPSFLAPLGRLDGTVTGTLNFGEKFVPFFWYGDEVHLPFPL